MVTFGVESTTIRPKCHQFDMQIFSYKHKKLMTVQILCNVRHFPISYKFSNH